MSFLEEFINSVNYLPGEVCRSLELLKLLDEKSKQSLDESQNLSQDYFSTLKREQGVISENQDLLTSIREQHQKSLNYSEEKVAVAKQLLDTVEFHLSKLKKDLDVYKKEISADIENAEEKTIKKIKIERNSLFESSMGLYMDMDMPEELPVDDNRAYCYCGKGSYGEMIECEGTKCKRGWFHMECAGLTSLPGGSWYCQDCEEERKKTKGR